MDTIEPFVKTARDDGKGLFVLVRTSNPGSADLQDVKTEDGRTFASCWPNKLRPIAAKEGLVGDQRLQLDRRGRRRDADAHDDDRSATGCRSRSSSSPATARRARPPR